MKTNKGFIVPLLLGVIALLVIGGGIFIYQNKKSESPVVVDVGTEQSGQFQQPVNINNSDIASLKTYSNSSFQFEYPSLVSIKQNGAIVTLSHSIEYKHSNFCDFKGGAPSLDKISDFNVSLMVSSQSLKDTILNQTSGYSPKEFLENDTLKLSEGFIDKFTVGSLNGFQVTSGLEGCGTYIYYFPISAAKTLVVNRSFVPELSSINSDSKLYLSLPGIIAPSKEEEFFLNILSTFKFTEPIVQSGATNWKTYTNTTNGFSFQYPANYTIGENAINSYLPVQSYSGGKIIITAEMPRSFYPANTSFDNASFSINSNNNLSLQKCEDPYGDIVSSKPDTINKTINGITFYGGESSGAGMSHQAHDKYFNTYHNGVCYELIEALRTGWGSDSVTTSVDEKDVFSKLDAILDTFKFRK